MPRSTNSIGSLSTQSTQSSADGQLLQPQSVPDSNNTGHFVPQGAPDIQVLDSYNLGGIGSFLGAGATSQLSLFLSNPSIPEDRKQALVASIASRLQNLPSQSGMDKFSEAVIGTSNYQKAMQKLSGELGTLVSDAINANYEEGYNSAQQQASRERSAGVNTDLAGISSDAAGKATDNNEMAAGYSGLAEPISGSEFVSYGMQGIQLILGFCGQVQGWIANDISNATAEVALDNQVRDNIRNAFAGVVQDKDSLDLKAIEYVQDYYSNFGESGLDKLTSREDLENWIKDYNSRNPNRKPLSIGDLYGSAILKAAKSQANPFTGLRAKRAYNRAMNSLSPASPYVQSYIKSLEATAAGSEKQTIKDQLEIKSLMADYGKAYQEAFSIVQEAENEYNQYTAKFYKKRNGSVGVVTGEDENGLPISEQKEFTDLEVQAEAEQYESSRVASMSAKAQQKLKGALRKTFDDRLENIKKTSGPDSWHYILASILYPALAEYLENRAIEQIGSIFSRPSPAKVNSTSVYNNTRYDYGARNTTINNGLAE